MKTMWSGGFAPCVAIGPSSVNVSPVEDLRPGRARIGLCDSPQSNNPVDVSDPNTGERNQKPRPRFTGAFGPFTCAACAQVLIPISPHPCSLAVKRSWSSDRRSTSAITRRAMDAIRSSAHRCFMNAHSKRSALSKRAICVGDDRARQRPRMQIMRGTRARVFPRRTPRRSPRLIRQTRRRTRSRRQSGGSPGRACG